MRAFVRYDNKGIIVPTSFVMKKTVPKVGQWKEISTSKSVSGSPAESSQKNLRAFVRYNGENKVVAGSIVLRGQVPTGNWSELTYDLSRPLVPEPTTTTTSTTVAPTTDFVFEVTTASDGDAFVLPLDTTSSINASIDWGDGTVNTVTSYNDANAFHTYTTAGVYTVSMSGIIDGWDYLSPDNAGTDKTQFGDISNWGTFEVTMVGCFYQCTNLTVSATDSLTITSGSNTFNGCTSLTTIDLSNWDVSGATTMTAMFRGCTSLTFAIFTGLDTSTITSFNSLFNGATSLATVTDFDSLNFDLVTDISSCFLNCIGLT